VRRLHDPAERAYVVTSDSKRGIREFFWRGDSHHIIYVQDHDGDENWNLFQVAVSEGNREAHNLTPGAFQAKVVAHLPQYPDQVVIACNERDPRFHDAYLLDLNSGKRTLLAENPGNFEYYIVDNKLGVRAALARMKDGSAEIRVRDNERSAWRRLTGWTDEDVDGELFAFSENDRAVWYTSSAGSDLGQLLETDLATGKTRVLARDKANQFDAGKILVDPARRTLQAVQFNREHSHWEAQNRGVAADFRALGSVHRGDFEILSGDSAGRYWTVKFVVDDGPAWFYLYDRRKQSAQVLFSDRPQLERYKLAAMHPVTFKARDGLPLHGYLTLPAVSPGRQGRFPLVVYPHGGPYARDDWGFNENVQLFANRGYAVLQINYRGSTGYGKKYLQAAFRERGGKMSTDLLDGKNWAVAQGYADPKRTCMYGVSYGGYAVLIALSFTPNEFVCGVEAYGASNLVSLLRSFPPWWALYRLQWERRVGRPEEEEFLKSRSALFKVQEIRSPLLIGQGANDPRVAKAESDQIVDALRRFGKEVTYIVFPDEGHGFERPENRRKWVTAAEAFLKTHLGGRAEAPTTEDDWRALEQ